LGVAAAIYEREVESVVADGEVTPITPEILVPRLGEYLIERGVLTQEKLQKALDYCQELRNRGERRLVGQALLELGMVDRETLDQVVTEQILQLQSALQQVNLQLEQRVRERTHELQTALNKLSELNQLMSNFVSNVSHELRTPLTHIKGYLDLLSDGTLGSVTEDQSRAVEVMQRSEARLEVLIEELIQFSMDSSGTLALQLTEVDLRELVETALSRVGQKAHEREIHLRMVYQAESLRVKVDSDKLRYVIGELLDNAIKFTPCGGNVSVSLISEDSLVSVSVQDTGIGIAKEKLTEIFEPFHQLDGSVTRRYGGVGIGLALVRNIIEAHGSTIEAFSDEGKGSRFVFRLPLV